MCPGVLDEWQLYVTPTLVCVFPHALYVTPKITTCVCVQEVYVCHMSPIYTHSRISLQRFRVPAIYLADFFILTPHKPKTHTLAIALFSSIEESLQLPDSLGNVSPVIGSLASSCEAFGAAKLKVEFREGLVLLREAFLLFYFFSGSASALEQCIVSTDEYGLYCVLV